MGASVERERNMTRLGIIGTGWGARVQVPAFRSAGFEITAIAGASESKTQQIARDLAIPFATADWRQLIERADVELVSVVAPPSLHREMALAVMNGGKHLLSEKPTALDAAEAQAMMDAAKKVSTIAIIDHELRFLPSWRALKAQIETIGAIRNIDCRYTSAGRGDRQRAWNWWSDAAAGGGVFGAVGSHLIDAVRYFAGEITETRATLRTTIDERPYDGSSRRVTSDDLTLAELRLESGASATMSFVSRRRSRRAHDHHHSW